MVPLFVTRSQNETFDTALNIIIDIPFNNIAIWLKQLQN